METPPFYALLFAHLSFLVLGFGSVMVTDLYGLLWVRDRVRFTQLTSLSGVTGRFVWAGWAGMVAAGVPLLVLKGEVDALMVVKLFFVALLGVNGVVLHRLHGRVARYREGEDVPDVFMFRLMVALGVSQLGWWGALTIGFLHRHVQSVIEWPDSPWLVIGLILGGVLAVWAAGEAVLRRRG